MIKKISQISIAFLLIFSSCAKTVNKTCTCKNAYGDVMSTESHSGDKKSAQSFENDCQKKSIKSSVTSNGVTTSTTIPCEIS